ncbi:Holliday junction branch migration protein RuvA [Acuticoccus sp. I52.16.1]|uniref:Holliday junction branch migration protein RuvA n=1 Tax=Acuticoccus sp. I52.16.1 TaxID=2928472 RepID=UPI001FD4079D|nr:Holliday junction branch migration protein RuvA [Acuticoccus sp. I52.16.1]UOM36199.1 Holliday junction branch migration protein RuvA [Acuticoccus sp. I52.16.1]
MIGRLVGTVAEIDRDALIVDVHGVGYEVFVPARDLAAVTPGTAVTLVVETVVREDLIRLYGFRDHASRDWFRLLQSVQGVGAKVALAVLSVLPAEQLAVAIATNDRTAIARAPGVGKRVAERIATELKAKAPAPAFTVGGVSGMADAAPAEDDAIADAVSALTNLGYDAMSARGAVLTARKARPEAGAAELIRAGLKALSA